MNKQSSSLHFYLPVCLNYMSFLFLSSFSCPPPLLSQFNLSQYWNVYVTCSFSFLSAYLGGMFENLQPNNQIAFYLFSSSFFPAGEQFSLNRHLCLTSTTKSASQIHLSVLISHLHARPWNSLLGEYFYHHPHSNLCVWNKTHLLLHISSSFIFPFSKSTTISPVAQARLVADPSPHHSPHILSVTEASIFFLLNVSEIHSYFSSQLPFSCLPLTSTSDSHLFSHIIIDASTEVMILLPRGNLALSGDIFHYHKGRGDVNGTRLHIIKMLLNIMYKTVSIPTKNDPAQEVNNAMVEIPALHEASYQSWQSTNVYWMSERTVFRNHISHLIKPNQKLKSRT